MSLFNFRRVPVLLLILAVALTGVFSARAASVNYTGLIYSGNTNTAAQSGFFNMSLSANRKFDGRMFIGQKSANFSGRFDTNGAADITVKMTVDNSCYGCDPVIIDIETQKLWDVTFQLSDSGDSVSGGVHIKHRDFPDGTLFGKRSSFSRSNQFPTPGKFTFVFAGSGDPANTNFPTGNGPGTITIDSSGDVGISGSLADNSPFSFSTMLCDDGTFPVFDPLYGGKGMIQGWLGLTNSPDTDLGGDVIWTKPNFAGRTFFPAGFTNDVPVAGSRYVLTKPPITPVLNWPKGGVVIFQGGNLSSPFTNAILLNVKNEVINLNPENKLKIKIQPKTGRFTGSVKDPSTGDKISFSGVLLQNQEGGLGYFPDAPLSGQVLMEPAGP